MKYLIPVIIILTSCSVSGTTEEETEVESEVVGAWELFEDEALWIGTGEANTESNDTIYAKTPDPYFANILNHQEDGVFRATVTDSTIQSDEEYNQNTELSFYMSFISEEVHEQGVVSFELYSEGANWHQGLLQYSPSFIYHCNYPEIEHMQLSVLDKGEIHKIYKLPANGLTEIIERMTC